MVVVDRLTKYAHFCALSHPFKESTVATASMETIQKLHGNQKIIISHRDPIFIENFWTNFFSCLDTQLSHSSSYHPQSDVQTKIVNKCLEGYVIFLYLIINNNGSSVYLSLNGGITLTSILQKK